MANRRRPKPEREQVALVHPSGSFTVLVSPARAVTLRTRGYKNSTASDAPAQPTRAELNARAKAAGIPAKGTNEELLAAVVTAEAATV
jgi:hypothetical protein